MTREKMLWRHPLDGRQYDHLKSGLKAESKEAYRLINIKKLRKIRNKDKNGYRLIKSRIKEISYYNKAVKWEPEITAQVKAAAQKTGMDMAGIDNRIKSRISYLNKIRRKYDSCGCHYEVKDVLRYTYTASGEELVEKVSKVIEHYAGSGYNVVEIKNYWLDGLSPYNGINTTLRSPKGQIFELQYHTPESFKVKSGKMHELYERQRYIKDACSREYLELGNQMFELIGSMEIPRNIEKLGNHK